MDPTTLTALLTALMAGLGTFLTWRSSATKAEVESLRATIVELRNENDRLRKVSADEYRVLKQRLTDVEQDNILLRAQVKDMQSEIDRLTSENHRLKEKTRRRPQEGKE